MGDGYFFGTWFYGKPRRREPAWRRDEKLLKIDEKNESITGLFCNWPGGKSFQDYVIVIPWVVRLYVEIIHEL